MKSQKIKVIIPALITVLIIILLLGTVYFIKRNTHFLNFRPSREEIEKNNRNFDSKEILLQDLIVPEQFRIGEFRNPHQLYLHKDFQISVYAAGMNAPRFFDFDQENNMYAVDKAAGKVYYLPDLNKDGAADRVEEFDSGLKNPHGIDYFDGDLYVAEENQVVVYRAITANGKYFTKETLISGLPSGGHVTRTVLVGADNKIYLTVGSSCNVCEERDKRRAAMIRYDLDGTGEEIFAEGLRNTVGFIFEPSPESAPPTAPFKIWGVDNGRDLIGDDIPPEEVNLIEEGKHYGWPYCYGNKTANPEYANRQDFCANQTEAPVYEMQAHSAPLDIALIPAEFGPQRVKFPEELRNNFFIAFHGSWNRSIPTGYKVVRIDRDSDRRDIVDFVTGWLDENGKAWGRPVGIKFDLNGDMFISDDSAGAIYKIIYKVSFDE